MTSVPMTEAPHQAPPSDPATGCLSVCDVALLTPPWRSAWEAYVAKHPEATLFHTLAWRDAVEHAFGHEAVYLTARRDERLVGLLPMFFVPSKIAGRMLVSVPYGVGGGIVADDHEAGTALFAAAQRVARKRCCGVIDLRSERAVIPDLPVVNHYVGFRRDLPREASEVLEWLPRKARAAARNARQKYRLSVSFGDEHLRRVWHLYTLSMRRLGSLAYPFSLFERLAQATPKEHWVSVVRWRDRPVAGLVTFLFKDRVMPYFIGTTNEARRCSAANYVYLTAMERGVRSGYRVFDFGRSRRDNTGSYNFKRNSGFEPRPLGYQHYLAPGHIAPDLTPDDRRFRLARRLWTHLPLCVTRTAGARLARHIPG